MSAPPHGPDGEGTPAPSWPHTELARGIVAAPTIAGIVGIASLPLLIVLRRPKSVAVKVAAYGCPLFAGLAPVLHDPSKREADDGNAKDPRQRLRTWLSDQATRVEPQKAQALGAAACLLAASHRRLPGLRRWQQWLGLASIGAGTGEIGQRAFYRARRSGRLWDGHDAREQPEDSMVTLRDDVPEGETRRDGDALAQKTPMGPSLGREQEPSQSSSTAFALTAADPGMQSSPENIVLHINMREGPHCTAHEPGETDMKPIPVTNYDWAMPADRVVAELEDHIRSLRSHRAKLSAEAQVLWWWLAQKEAQYYRLREQDTAVGYEAEQAKKQLLAYIQTLAGEHRALWMAVGKLDWMIADSQKRIGQHQQSPHGFFHNLSEPTVPAEARTLGFSFERLHERLQLLEHAIKESTASIATLTEDLKDPKMPKVRREVRDQLNKLPKREREKFWRELIEAEKENIHEATIELAALEEVLRDAERRITQLTKDE